jgi:hypothetical protein
MARRVRNQDPRRDRYLPAVDFEAIYSDQRTPLAERLKQVWKPGLLLVAFGAATILLTAGVLSQSGRFTPPAIWALALIACASLVLSLACLPMSGRLRFGSLSIFVLAAMVLPTAVLVVYRWRTGIPLAVHDGMFQTEIVSGRLLQGHDPYGTDFTLTELVRWFYYTPDGAAIAHHYIYYPAVVLVSLPVYLIERAAGLIPDLRPLMLAVAAAAAWLIFKLPFSWRARYLLAVILFLNPFFGWLEGRNDILWLTPILIAVVFLSDGRWPAASWSLGVGAALKLFAFPFALFMAAAIWYRWRRGAISGRAAGFSLAGLIAPLVVTAAPFVLWDAAAFWRDTVGWLFDNPPGFPIYGFGLGQALLLTHVVPSSQAAFPFGLVQLALGVPILILGWLRLSREPTPANILGPAATLLAVMVLCGRFTNANYLAGLVFLMALSIAVRRHASRSQQATLREAA